MKRVLLCAVLAVLVVPAWTAYGVVDYFVTTVDGSFSVHDLEGYANNGDGVFRLSKYNQHMGFMDWDGAPGEVSGQSMADFIANNGGVIASAYLYVRAAWGGDLRNEGAIITLRTSNVGNLVEDAGSGCCGDYLNPAPGIDGASEAHAFRSSAPPFLVKGHGIAEPWKVPSTSMSPNPNGWNAGDDVQWLHASGQFYIGWDSDERWAVEHVLGSANSQNANTVQRFLDSGQLVNQDGAGNYLPIGPGSYVGTEDPLDRNNNPFDDEWYKVEINPDIILDIATNAENKGLVFWNYGQGLVVGWGNDRVYSKDQSGGLWAPYLAIDVVPEPSTLALLGLSGLMLIRRRRA